MFQKQGDSKLQTSWKGMAGGTPPKLLKLGALPHPLILLIQTYPPLGSMLEQQRRML